MTTMPSEELQLPEKADEQECELEITFGDMSNPKNIHVDLS